MIEFSAMIARETGTTFHPWRAAIPTNCAQIDFVLKPDLALSAVGGRKKWSAGEMTAGKEPKRKTTANEIPVQRFR